MTSEGESASTLDHLAAMLDEAGVTLDLIRRDFAGSWRVWFSPVTRAYHARRAENFREDGGERRYALAASSPGRLALLLLNQAELDAEHQAEQDGAT